jgi:hypothetical protein
MGLGVVRGCKRSCDGICFVFFVKRREEDVVLSRFSPLWRQELSAWDGAWDGMADQAARVPSQASNVAGIIDDSGPDNRHVNFFSCPARQAADGMRQSSNLSPSSAVAYLVIYHL